MGLSGSARDCTVATRLVDRVNSIYYRRLSMNGQLLERDVAELYADWFRALADPTRVQIVALLAQHGKAVPVGELTAALPVGQSTVSHHLAALAAVGFVQVQRLGTRSLYTVNPACVDCFPSAADIVMGRRPPQSPPPCGPQAPDTERLQP
jgi:DNA-binding transcriptional ArsR family regulator